MGESGPPRPLRSCPLRPDEGVGVPSSWVGDSRPPTHGIDQDLTPPAARPATIRFWKKRTRMISGIVTTMPAAIWEP